MDVSWLLLCSLFTVTASSPDFLHKLLQRHRRHSSGCQNQTISLDGLVEIEDTPYSRPYENNDDCVWTITAQQGETILLLSRDFLLEDSYKCRYDFVEIFDGEYDKASSAGKFCGRKDVRYISHSNKLFIHFRSDSSVTAPGFLFTATPLPIYSNSTCNSTLTGDTQKIQSPNYPHRYPHNLTCVYNIQAPANKKVKLEFKKFVLERGPCVDDYLTVYDGSSSAASQLGQFCGRGVPKSITSSGAYLLLYFHTNEFVRDRGFDLSYTFVTDGGSTANIVAGELPSEFDPDCSSIITTEGQNVTSPTFSGEEFYLQRKKCRTLIVPPEGHGVEVLFKSFDLEHSLDCMYDNLNVTYNLKQGGSTSTRLCGYLRSNHTSRCITSYEGNATLYFKSDLLFEGIGYRATYKFIGPNDTSECLRKGCGDSCAGYCYDNGEGMQCACLAGKVPPECVQNITWVKPLPENLTRYEGSDIELSCEINHPYSITVWDLNDFMFPNQTRDHIKVKGEKLIISGARVNDAGVYTCTVQAGDWLESQTMTLMIKPEEEYCGRAPNSLLNPNVNAYDATIAGKNATKAPNPIPWQVMLFDKTAETPHCGGVLISERHVLTAAHCINTHEDIDSNKIRVGSSKCKKGGQIRSVARYITHPKFNKETLEYDFGLLELEKPIRDKSDEIYPICLPTAPGVWDDINAGHRGIISGCGKNSEGKVPDRLHMVDVPFVERETCASYQNTGNRQFTSEMFCAGFDEEDVGDACDGDSGGPLAAKINGRWTLLGIISFGRGCAEKGKFGFYGNVSFVLPWVRDIAPSCGKTSFIEGNHQSGKIINGEKALPKQFPWQAALLLRGQMFCSGTLIGSTWALTAKHCFDGKSKAELRKIKIILGDLTPTPNEGVEDHRLQVDVVNIIKHKTADIALLQLGGVVKYGEYVQPVCLPAMDETMQPGSVAAIAGWGNTEKRGWSPSSHLLYTEMTRINASVCESTYRRDRRYTKSQIFCAVGKNSSQAAAGDSGAGLVWRNEGSHVLSGVHSGGEVRKDLPGMFVELEKFLPWIKAKIGWKIDDQ